DDLVGVLHLAEGLFVVDLGQHGIAPVLAHPRVDEVLVDAGQFLAQDLVQQVDDPRIPLHGVSLPGWAVVYGGSRVRPGQCSAHYRESTRARAALRDQSSACSSSKITTGAPPGLAVIRRADGSQTCWMRRWLSWMDSELSSAPLDRSHVHVVVCAGRMRPGVARANA